MTAVCLGLCLALVGWGAPVNVDDTSAASGSPEYQKLIAQGVDEFRRSNYAEAHSLFERAHAVQPNARTLRGMGLAEFESHHPP